MKTFYLILFFLFSSISLAQHHDDRYNDGSYYDEDSNYLEEVEEIYYQSSEELNDVQKKTIQTAERVAKLEQEKQDRETLRLLEEKSKSYKVVEILL